MIRPCAMLLAVLFLGACAATAVDRLDKLDALIDTEVDAVVGLIEDRRCQLRVDLLARLAEDRGLDWLRGWVLQCPSTKRLFDSI